MNDKQLQRELEAGQEEKARGGYYDVHSPCEFCFKDTCYGCEEVPDPEERPDSEEDNDLELEEDADKNFEFKG